MAPRTLEGQALGKYQVLEQLGRGGMAQVYRAYHPQLDRYVAIKVLRSDLVGEQEFMARFTREARSVAALRHPNIVQVYDFDVQDDYYYMVMELMEGDSLKARMNSYRGRGERMPLGEIASILIDVLHGLGYAHAEGIIHRDVKPANILLTRRGQAVITDFGIAQILGGTNYTITGALMGTLHYMAPEQGLGTNVDGRSDLYSLGVVLYEILTGYPPFDADTPLAILMKHLNDPLTLPREPDQVIPAPFERVVLKALAKKPEDRYQSAGDMIQALREAAAGCAGESAQILSLTSDLTGDIPASEPESEPLVYSGTAKQKISDMNFAADVTDMNLEERLREGQESQGRSPGPVESAENRILQEPPGDLSSSFDEVVQSASRLFSSVGGVISVALVNAAEEVKQREAGAAKIFRKELPLNAVGEQQPAVSSQENFGIGVWDDRADSSIAFEEGLEGRRGLEVRFQSAGQAGLLGAGLLVGANFLAVGLGVTTGWWGLYQYGWPAELLLVAVLLYLIMGATSNIWILIPAGILMGNGLLMAYYSITGNWRMWGLLLPFEPALVFGTIFLAHSLARHAPEQARRFARRLGWPLAVVTGGMVVLVGLGSLMASLIRGVFSQP